MDSAEHDAAGLTLLGALKQLKDDITQLQADSDRSGAGRMFLIDEGELQLKLVARETVTAEAGVAARFKLFLAMDVKASGKAASASSSENVQMLTLKFRALGAPEPTKKGGAKGGGISFTGSAGTTQPSSPRINEPTIQTDVNPMGKTDFNPG